MKRINQFLLAFVSVLMFACKPDPNPTPVDPNDTIQPVNLKGVFVLNEGNYQFSNASLSFYDPEADTVANNLFYKANNAPIGDVAESMALVDGKLYIVVNNSNLIYKVDANTLKCDLTKPFKLGDFYSPREMYFISPDKAYVTDIIGTDIWIVNPQEMTHTGSIAMGKTTEKMVPVGNELYVSNWSQYYIDPNSHDSYNTVQVVDMNNNVKVEFQLGEAVIQMNDEIQTYINDLTNYIKNTPGRRILIWGHTCNLGKESKNIELGMQRAEAMRKLLISAGCPINRVMARSKGSSEPLVPNTSEANRQKNRRIEIVIK